MPTGWGGRIAATSPCSSTPHTGEDYIKRIVGLPGDTVQVTHGILSVNAKPSSGRGSPIITSANGSSRIGVTRTTSAYRYSESLPGGLSHEILGDETNLPEDSLPQDSTPIFKVPPDRFFAMGDNRDNSNDSRLSLGYVPLANLVGRAEFSLFSRARVFRCGGSWSTSRLAFAGSACCG